MSPIALFAIVGLVATASAVKVGDDCQLGARQRIGKGSYYEECVSKFETAGCFASWEKDTDKRFVKDGETIDRMYKGNTVGFRYQCEMSNGYIQFAPISCVLNKKAGFEVLKLNASGRLDNGQNVKCKQNNEGEYSFEFGNDGVSQQ